MKALWPFDAATLFAAMIAASAVPTASAIENTTTLPSNLLSRSLAVFTLPVLAIITTNRTERIRSIDLNCNDCAPHNNYDITLQHPTPAPLCDEWRFAATDGDLLNQTSQSLRFDVAIFEDVQINSIKVFLAPGFSNMPYKIFFHPDIWQVETGNWTQIASGNNGEVDSDGFTASLPFDSPLSFSADTGLISFRIDMANRLVNFRADFPTFLGPPIADCPNCPFGVSVGLASAEVDGNLSSIVPDVLFAFPGVLEFCRGLASATPTESLSITASPTALASVAPTVAPTATCRSGEAVGLPRPFFIDQVESQRFDIEVLDTVEITGMGLALSTVGNQPYSIFYRLSPWDAPGVWTKIASGTIEARGIDEFTDVITFDPPLSFSASDGVVAIRIDTRTNQLGDIATSIEPIPSDWFDCQNCPFTMFTGISSGIVGDNPPPLFNGIFDYFMGSLELCNGSSMMPSAVPSPAPSALASSTSSSTPSFPPSASPSNPPSNTPSGAPSMQPTSAPTAAPTSSAFSPMIPSTVSVMLVMALSIMTTVTLLN